MVQACESARSYTTRADPYKLGRDKIKRSRAQREALATAAHKLGNACRANAPGMHDALFRAEQQCAVFLEAYGFRRDAPPPLTETMTRFLLALAEILRADSLNELIDPGANAAMGRHGNLIYRRDIGAGRLPAADTLLAVELEFYLRAFSAKRRPDVHAWREDSMRVGRPGRQLVAMFVQAAFPKSALNTTQAVQQRIRELPPGTRVGNWPEHMG